MQARRRANILATLLATLLSSIIQSLLHYKRIQLNIGDEHKNHKKYYQNYMITTASIAETQIATTHET
jgi:hypothetical protein